MTTYSKDHILQYIEQRFEVARIEKQQYIQSLYAKKICLFGAGNIGKAVYRWLDKNNIPIDSFCDNDKEKWGKEIIGGVRCIGFEELRSNKDNFTVLVCATAAEEIYGQLVKNDIPNAVKYPLDWLGINMEELFTISLQQLKEKVSFLCDILCDVDSLRILYYKMVTMLAPLDWLNEFSYKTICTFDPYFCSDIIHITQDDVIVDGGAFTGDTLADYLNRHDGRLVCKKYLCYEMDKNNFETLKRNVYQTKLMPDEREKINLYNFGIFDQYTEISYSSQGSASSMNMEEKNINRKMSRGGR